MVLLFMLALAEKNTDRSIPSYYCHTEPLAEHIKDYGYSLPEIPVIHSSRSVRSTKQNYSTPRNSNLFRVVHYTLEVMSSNPVTWVILDDR